MAKVRRSTLQTLLLIGIVLVALYGGGKVYRPRLQVVAGDSVIGETWGEGEVVYEDGTVEAIGLPQTFVEATELRLLDTLPSPKMPDRVNFRVKATAFDISNWPKPSYRNLLGFSKSADDWYLECSSTVTIKVNGEVKYQSPESGVSVYWGGTNAWDALSKLIGMNKFYVPGETVVAQNVDGWKLDQYLSASSKTTVDLYLTQSWKVYAIWFGDQFTPPFKGVPKANPGLFDPLPVNLDTPFKSALVNPDPASFSYDPKTQLPSKGFRLAATPLTWDMGVSGEGAKRPFQLAVDSWGGYTGTVSFSTVGLATGFSAVFVPDKLTFTSSTTLQGAELRLTSSSIVQNGAYSFKVVGSDGSMTSEVTLTLNVNEKDVNPSDVVGRTNTILSVSLSSKNVKPKASLTVTGKLRDAFGRTLAGEKVQVNTDFGFSQQAVTSSLGEFSVQMTAPETLGIYAVTVTYAGNGLYVGDVSSVQFEVSKDAVSPDPVKNFFDWFKNLLPESLKPYWWIILAVAILFGLVLLRWIFGGGR